MQKKIYLQDEAFHFCMYEYNLKELLTKRKILKISKSKILNQYFH